MLEYYSTDKAGNKEAPHSAVRGIGSPSFSDLSDLINNSGIDNSGIKNALLAKVAVAEAEQSRGGSLNSLNALLNQLNALEGKHGLDGSTVANMEAMIQVILRKATSTSMLSPVNLRQDPGSMVPGFRLGLSLFGMLAGSLSGAATIFQCKRNSRKKKMQPRASN
jgi:hypothetical protein